MSGDIMYDKSIFVQLKIYTFQIWLHKEVFMVFPHLSLVLRFFFSCGLRTRKFCRVCIQIIANTCFQNCCYESITMLWMCFFHDRKHYCCTGPWLSQLLREIFCRKIFLFQMQGLGSELYISQQNRCICVFCWTNVSPLLKQWVNGCSFVVSVPYFNSLWPNDAMWHYGSWSALGQVTACCLSCRTLGQVMTWLPDGRQCFD